MTCESGNHRVPSWCFPFAVLALGCIPQSKRNKLFGVIVHWVGGDVKFECRLGETHNDWHMTRQIP